MAPLAVDPAALDSAGGAVVAAGAGLGAVISSLTAALAGCAGMAGDDPAGAVFGRSYDGSAAALVQAMSVARNGLCNLGDGVRMSAHNYSLAEAMSDVAGRAAPLPAPPPSGCVGVGGPVYRDDLAERGFDKATCGGCGVAQRGHAVRAD